MVDEGNEEAEIVGGFLKSESEMVTAYIQPYRGTLYGHLRILVPSAAEEGEWVHTYKGVSLAVDRLGELREAVESLPDVAAPNRVVAAFSVGKDQIRVGTSRFAGNQYVYVRRFYEKHGQWNPTQKGVSVRSEQLDDLVDLVRKLSDTAGHGGA